MNKKVPVGLYPRDILNDWRKRKCTCCKKDIKRDSIINTARLMKMLPEGVASYPHLRNHTRYLRLNEGLSQLDHNVSDQYWEVGCSIRPHRRHVKKEIKILLYHFTL